MRNHPIHKLQLSSTGKPFTMKAMTVKSRVAASIFCALATSASLHVHAKSVTVTGEIETKRPILLATPSKEVFEAFVEPITVEIKGADNSGCDLTPIPDQAISADNIDKLVCLYEFQTPYALDRSVDSSRSTILKGTFDKIGVTDIPITATFFSGSDENPINIPIDNVEIEAVEPVPINVTSLNWSALMVKDIKGDVFEINSPLDSNKIVVDVKTEVKDYDRVVTFENYGECEIRAGKDGDCQIYLNQDPFGSEDDRLGEKTITIHADAKNRYFLDNQLAPLKTVTVKWDSRLPEYVTLLKGEFENENSHTLPDGTVITAKNGEWIQLFTTPHSNRSDDWWKVESSIEMVPNLTEHKEPPEIILNGADYTYLWKARKAPSEIRIVSRDIQYYGDYIAVSYDTSVLQGAEYSYKSKTFDKYLNTQFVEGESIVENLPIELFKFVGGKLQLDYDDKIQAAYFPKDVKFAMFSRFRDLSVKSAVINGENVQVENVDNNSSFFQLKSFPTNMISGETTSLNLVVEDSRGYEHQFSIPFIAQPFEVKLKNDTAFSDVQKYKVEMYQEILPGMRECQFFTTEEDAKRTRFQTSNDIHCYLVWENLDDSMSVEAKSYKYTIRGVPKAPNPTYNYRVHFVDSTLDTAISELKAISLIGEDVPEVVLNIENADEIIEPNGTMAFAVPVEGGPVATIRAGLVNADSFVIGTNPFGDDVIVDINQMGTALNNSARSFFRVDVDPGELWKTGYLTVTTGYKHNESYTKSQNVKMVFVPNERVEAFLKTEDRNAVNTVPHKVTAGVGEYKRLDRSYTYNSAVHGDWKVELKRHDIESRDWITIATADKLNSDGTADFEIDLTNYEGDESYRFKTVMTIHSNYPAYSREIESRVLSLNVNEGSGIQANIDTSRWFSEAPFRMRADLAFENMAYRKAFGSAKWYFREYNDSEWTLIPDSTKHSVNNTFTETGRYYIKAIAKNKFTDVETEIISPEILTYKLPEFELVRNKSEYVGQDILLSVKTDEDPSNFDYQWSTGKCTDWQEGTERFSYRAEVKGRVYVCTRVAYKNTTLAGKNRWRQVRSNINVEEADPLRINIYSSRTSEVGYETELVATINTPSDIRHDVVANWYSPSGSLIPSEIEVVNTERIRLVAKYTVTEEDLAANRDEDETKPFSVRAHVTGIVGTEAEANSKMKVLVYRFPEFELEAKQEFTYFPTESIVNAKMLTRPEVPVQFTYEWLERDGNKLISARDNSKGSRAVYNVDREGLITYVLLIKDDRGNERIIETFSSTEKPQDAEIKIHSSFSNRKMRYPVDGSFRARVDYDHRRDKIDSFEWYVNGELVGDSSELRTPRLYYTAKESGDYEVKFIAKSILGATDEQTYNFNVIDNQKPVCTLDHREDTTSFVFRPNCKDTDGKILRTLIDIPELGRSSTSKDIRILKTNLVGYSSLSVDVTVWDDSDETTNIIESFSVPDKVSRPESKTQ